MNTTSGVGVLDKAMTLMSALEMGPLSLADLVDTTTIPRPTVHRLAAALETHGMLGRDSLGRYELGPRLGELSTSRSQDTLLTAARDVLIELRDTTGESAQLFRRQGNERQCMAVADRIAGLRDTVPLGISLPLTAGSAAQVLLAWAPTDERADLVHRAVFDDDTLDIVQSRGWADSVEQREAGVASVSVPLRGPGGRVLAALSVSGPKERLGDDPGERYANRLTAAADDLSTRLYGPVDGI